MSEIGEAPYTNLLEEALEAWEGTRKGVLEEAENIPRDRWDFRPHEEARSVGEILRHVLESGLLMAGELTRADGDFRRQSHPEFIREYTGHLPEEIPPEDLLDQLRMSFAEGAAAFRGVGELWMLQYIHRFDGKPGTRLAWMEHGIAHESYHRGQLALCARIMGLTPALTQRIHGTGS